MPTVFPSEQLLWSVTGGFYEVYNTLGFGFREHIYKMALERELRDRGHLVQRERLIDVFYKHKRLGRDRIDLIVDDVLVIEVKCTVYLKPGARDQLYSYLRSTNLEVGLLLHFGPKPRFYRVRTGCSTPVPNEFPVL
jgi:GxxExxY protein